MGGDTNPVSGSANDPEWLQPGARFGHEGRYIVQRQLGAGGVGNVYEVEDARTGRRRALKLWREAVDDERVGRRFEREVFVGSRIASDNVIEILDVGLSEDRRPYIVMELLVGEALDNHLQRVQRVAFADASVILQQVSAALEKAHAQGIVHRDLKPSNIFLTRTADGALRVKILDFGLAALLGQGTRANQTMTLVGTPLYAAPEQLTLGASISPATDLYALGLVAYELLVGERYRTGETIGDLVLEARGKETSPAPTARAAAHGVALPLAFDAWMQRAAAVDPAARWSNAREMIDALLPMFGLERSKPGPGQALTLASELGSAPSTAPGTTSPTVSTGALVGSPTNADLGVTQDVEPSAQVGVSGLFLEQDATAANAFFPMLPRRMRRDVGVVVGFFSSAFEAFEVCDENMVLLKRAERHGSPFRFFATFMLELEQAEVHTQTFLDYSRPLASLLKDLPRDGPSVVLAIMEATELGRGVLDVIQDFRTRYAAHVVPLPIRDVRRAVEKHRELELVGSRLQALHPRTDPFDTGNPSATVVYALEATVGVAAKALAEPKPLVVLSGGPGSGKTSVVERLEYGLPSRRFVRLRCLDIVQREVTVVASQLVAELAPNMPAVEGESAPRRLARAFAVYAASKAPPLVVVLEDAEWLVRSVTERDVDAARQEDARAFWMTLYQACGPSVAVIATGVACQALNEPTWCGWKTPIAGRVKEIAVPPLSDAELQRMIDELGARAHVGFDAAALKRVAELSAGNMYAARRLCSQAFATRWKVDPDPLGSLTITKKDINDAARDLTATPDLFDLRGLGEEHSVDQAVLRAITEARPRGLAALQAVPGMSGHSSETLQASLGRLRRIGLVVVRDGRFALGVPLMEAWLRVLIGVPQTEAQAARPWRWAATGVAVSALLMATLLVYRRPADVQERIGDCLYEVEVQSKVTVQAKVPVVLRRDCDGREPPKGKVIAFKSTRGDFVLLRNAIAKGPSTPNEAYELNVNADWNPPSQVDITAQTSRLPSSLLVSFDGGEEHQLRFQRDWANLVEPAAERVFAVAGIVPLVLGLLLEFRDKIAKLFERLMRGPKDS